MERHWKLVLAGGLLAGLAGCKSTPTQQPTFPVNQPTAPSSSTAGKHVVILPDDKESAKKEGPLQTSTLIVFANNWVESVARDQNKPTAEREKLLNQARETYQEVLKREPKNAEALIGLGQLYHTSGEHEKLTEIEQKLRTLHPNNAKVWGFIAVRQGQARQWDAAAESYHKAAKLDPDNRMYRIHLGFTLARAGRYEEGYAWLSKSMKEVDARYNLAQMMIHNGQIEQARQHLAFALQVDPNFKVAQDQLVALMNEPATVPPGSRVTTVGHDEPATR